MARFVRLMFLALAALAAVSAAVWAASPTFSLKPGLRWVVVSKAANLNQAIGIAQHFMEQRTMVVRTDAGDLAVVIGPYRAKTIRQLTERNADLPPLPIDANLSRGEDFIETVWRQSDMPAPERVAPPAVVTAKSKAKLREQALDVRAAFKISKAVTVLNVTGKLNGAEVFKVALDDPDLTTANATVGIYRLDKITDQPQVVISTYTGGAHCCTHTWVITRPANESEWRLVDLGVRDGEGYAMEDVDADGSIELIGIDNNFLYAFDNYAESYAPVVYSQLAGDKIVDRSSDKALHDELERDLAYIEFEARTEPAKWNSNGFLAAWVASKIRLGQGDDAWSVMLENFNHNVAVPADGCESEDPAEPCQVDPAAAVPFPKALANFLQETGYGPLPMTAVTSVSSVH